MARYGPCQRVGIHDRLNVIVGENGHAALDQRHSEKTLTRRHGVAVPEKRLGKLENGGPGRR